MYAPMKFRPDLVKKLTPEMLRKSVLLNTQWLENPRRRNRPRP